MRHGEERWVARRCRYGPTARTFLSCPTVSDPFSNCGLTLHDCRREEDPYDFYLPPLLPLIVYSYRKNELKTRFLSCSPFRPCLDVKTDEGNGLPDNPVR